MLIDARTLQRIAAGEVTAALRRWRKPTVKAGGTLKTRIGVLAIDAVDVIDAVTPDDAAAAGFADVAAAEAALAGRDGALIRVRFHLAGPDPRLALRQDVPDEAGLAALAARVARLDRVDPWTRVTLDAIAAWPERSARDIAPELGFVRKPWKARVRSLKALGLTVSLRVGYRLSDRGAAVWEWIRAHTPGLHVRPEAPADADAVRAWGPAGDAMTLVAERAGVVVGRVTCATEPVRLTVTGEGADALVAEALLRLGRLGHATDGAVVRAGS